MKIKEALISKTNEIMSIKQISELDSSDERLQFLFCPNSRCSARLLFVPKGKNEEHLKTYKLNNHIDSCENFFERKTLLERMRYRNENAVPISEEKIKEKIARYCRELNKEDINPHQKTAKKPKANGIVGGNTRKKDGTSYEATLSRQGKNDVETPRTTVRRKELDGVSLKDVGKVILTHGRVEEVELNDESAKFVLIEKDKKTTVFFPEAFFATASQGVKNYLEILKNYAMKNNVDVVLMTEVALINDEIVLSVIMEECVRINVLERSGLSLVGFAARITTMRGGK
ncbi:hypothetical protein [Listeria seeligeri]|uniref:hypothetical protein n=1 Tax=Listeria seeligeri TaxID=1640 RepID=UPI00194110F8|nr:hypothetical protein [Listeria seeligeri]MBM5605260.1 hypothetical protein [Listeria seeligeri]MBM5676927.1 hypothetical protein [Listeria seeligeri]